MLVKAPDDNALERVLPLLRRMAARPEERSLIVAIDGRAASGKSTMAAFLGRITGAGVIHMDDFFLPPFLRTAARLVEPGGNVHYERFCEEVLPRLRQRGSFCYRWFDCSTMDYRGQRVVKDSRIRIVEGAYSAHPALGRYMDILAFSDILPKVQRERILSRNGEEGWENYRSRWIPMEERYIAVSKLRERADITL